MVGNVYFALIRVGASVRVDAVDVAVEVAPEVFFSAIGDRNLVGYTWR